MIKANPTIFKFYLSMMDSFSEYLSNKYSEATLDDPNHYKTVIIKKIVRMFHTLEQLVRETQDEVSARCVLRGILDSVTTYCFIYQREDIYDMMFRHYLYEIDGFITYKKGIIDGIMDEDENKYKFEYACNEVIRQIKLKLSSHQYQKLNNKNVKTIINNANWKYKSLDDPKGLTFKEMYKHINLDTKLICYYQEILSQHTHGLCLSNITNSDSEQLQKVLYESIPLADRIVQGMCRTFPQKELIKHFRDSKSYKAIINCEDFDQDDLLEFAKAVIMKDKTLY